MVCIYCWVCGRVGSSRSYYVKGGLMTICRICRLQLRCSRGNRVGNPSVISCSIFVAKKKKYNIAVFLKDKKRYAILPEYEKLDAEDISGRY